MQIEKQLLETVAKSKLIFIFKKTWNETEEKITQQKYYIRKNQSNSSQSNGFVRVCCLFF